MLIPPLPSKEGNRSERWGGFNNLPRLRSVLSGYAVQTGEQVRLLRSPTPLKERGSPTSRNNLMISLLYFLQL
ncbi:hypothetical protein E3V55_02960 [Candidatus Marinimicrobia bacterium MT.SAG.3]|nr:hypothetical protein E3V55_02960 [Candidatus Marinimicrobia bacterium MT.SAG.3]